MRAKDTATVFAWRASHSTARPGTVFASCSTTGTCRSDAATTGSKLAYEPIASRTSGANLLISRQQRRREKMLANTFLAVSGRAPVENRGPSHDFITELSMARPDAHTVTSCPRARSSCATASPGKECPPVPPHATMNFFAMG